MAGGEFREGGERPDVVDGEWAAFPGDPRLRQQVEAEGITTIAGLETAADTLRGQDAVDMGVPLVPERHLDEIMDRFNKEMGR